MTLENQNPLNAGFFSPFFRELVSSRSASRLDFKFFLLLLFLLERRDEAWLARLGLSRRGATDRVYPNEILSDSTKPTLFTMFTHVHW